MEIQNFVLDELERITGTDQVRHNLDLRLFDEELLDSLGTVELMVSLGRQFHIAISPASFERSHWETPELIVKDIADRLNHR